nr:unnamed protein product [Callosobruchus chinensis]
MTHEGNPTFDGNSDVAPAEEQSPLVSSGSATTQEFGEGDLNEASFPGGAQADAGSGFPQRSAGDDDDDKGDDAQPFNLGGKHGAIAVVQMTMILIQDPTTRLPTLLLLGTKELPPAMRLLLEEALIQQRDSTTPSKDLISKQRLKNNCLHCNKPRYYIP